MNRTMTIDRASTPQDRSRRHEAHAALLVGAVLATSVLVGCATGPRMVRTEVTSFDQWTMLPGDRRYVFTPTLEYENSLEMKSYEDIVRDELAAQGFRLASDPADANLTVTLRPSLSATRVRTRDFGYGPFYGGFGYGGVGYGRYGYGGFGGSGPFYGGAFFNDFDRYDLDIVRHRLELDIDAKGVTGKRYYEGRAETSDATTANAPVVPTLVRALFRDFPGNNGQTRRVDVPVERRAVPPAPETAPTAAQ